MYYDIKEVKYISGYKLEIGFENGTNGVADLKDYKNWGKVFKPFDNTEFFKKVFVHPELKVLCWPGDIDIAPETVYEMTNCGVLNK